MPSIGDDEEDGGDRRHEIHLETSNGRAILKHAKDVTVERLPLDDFLPSYDWIDAIHSVPRVRASFGLVRSARLAIANGLLPSMEVRRR